MATAAEWSCPICREPSGNIAYVGTCLHQFCRGCIMRWTRRNPSCPLCRQPVLTIIYPAPSDQSFVEMAVPQPSAPGSASPRQEPGAAEPPPRAHVAGFPPEAWALFFRNDAEILQPLKLWLNEVLCGACWWDVAFAQTTILASLCHYGLHEEALAREVRPVLHGQTAAFVRQLIEVATEQCAGLVRQRLDAASQQASPGAAASPGSSGAQGESRERPGQAGAGASGAGQSGGSSPGASRESGRRRGGGPEESEAAPKKPCRRRN